MRLHPRLRIYVAIVAVVAIPSGLGLLLGGRNAMSAPAFAYVVHPFAEASFPQVFWGWVLLVLGTGVVFSFFANWMDGLRVCACGLFTVRMFWAIAFFVGSMKHIPIAATAIPTQLGLAGLDLLLVTIPVGRAE